MKVSSTHKSFGWGLRLSIEQPLPRMASPMQSDGTPGAAPRPRPGGQIELIFGPMFSGKVRLTRSCPEPRLSMAVRAPWGLSSASRSKP